MRVNKFNSNNNTACVECVCVYSIHMYTYAFDLIKSKLNWMKIQTSELEEEENTK